MFWSNSFGVYCLLFFCLRVQGTYLHIKGSEKYFGTLFCAMLTWKMLLKKSYLNTQNQKHCLHQSVVIIYYYNCYYYHHHYNPRSGFLLKLTEEEKFQNHFLKEISLFSPIQNVLSHLWRRKTRETHPLEKLCGWSEYRYLNTDTSSSSFVFSPNHSSISTFQCFISLCFVKEHINLSRPNLTDIIANFATIP